MNQNQSGYSNNNSPAKQKDHSRMGKTMPFHRASTLKRSRTNSQSMVIKNNQSSRKINQDNNSRVIMEEAEDEDEVKFHDSSYLR